jgi:hypothetical protein
MTVEAYRKMRVRESGRRRAIREWQRNVDAWVEGSPYDIADGELIEIGSNPFLASTFTIRQGFDPVHEDEIVVLGADGKTYAML